MKSILIMTAMAAATAVPRLALCATHCARHWVSVNSGDSDDSREAKCGTVAGFAEVK